FQAEDGIRYFHVTGVQTCALPIYAAAPCKTSADCGATGLCGFPTSAACAAIGQCFPRSQGLCNAFVPGCACDGTTINLICGGLRSEERRVGKERGSGRAPAARTPQ